jgi:hypothetical protein
VIESVFFVLGLTRRREGAKEEESLVLGLT